MFRLLRYIGQYRFSAVFTQVEWYNLRNTTNVTAVWFLKIVLIYLSFLNGFDYRTFIFYFFVW